MTEPVPPPQAWLWSELERLLSPGEYGDLHRRYNEQAQLYQRQQEAKKRRERDARARSATSAG